MLEGEALEEEYFSSVSCFFAFVSCFFAFDINIHDTFVCARVCSSYMCVCVFARVYSTVEEDVYNSVEEVCV